MDWLRGGSSSWDEQLRSKISQAASSARRLAEQAELPQLGEQLRSSVQSLAEQSGQALRQEQADAQQLLRSLSTSAQTLAERTGAAIVTTADQVVGGVSSLGVPNAGGAGGAQACGDLAELGRSFESEARALETAASPGERAQRTLYVWHARLAPEVAGSETAALAIKALLQSQAVYIMLKALARTAAGRQVIRSCAAAPEPSKSAGSQSKREEETGAEAKAGQFLLRVLCRISAASTALLRQLLTLLADVAEESEKSTVGPKGTGGGAASENLQWILQLLTSSLMHADEVELNDAGQLQEVVDRAVGRAEPTAAAAGNDTCPPSPAIVESDTPAVGSEVWAAWPGDGRWFRARVKAVGAAAGGQVEVAWLRPPAGEGGEGDCEYLSASGGDDTEFFHVEAQEVVVVSNPRPSPSSTGVGTSEEYWAQQVASVEASARSFRELRGVCSALEAIAVPASGSAEDASLAASASILETLRTEGERRAAELAKAAVECADSGRGCEEQLSTSHQSFESEVAALREQQEAFSAREAELQAERDEICAKLQAVDEQLKAVRTTRKEAEDRENQIRATEKRVEHELQEELSRGTETGQSLAAWQRLLTEISAASCDVEDLLASRGTAVREAMSAREALGGRRHEVAEMCLARERARARSLEVLLAAWHAAIWGPGIDALMKDAGKLAALRALHVRAGSLAEQAWRETVQLAAEELGGGSLGADSEGMSRAAEKYKKMRQQLQGNLERLAKLESASAQKAETDAQIDPSKMNDAEGSKARCPDAVSAEPAFAPSDRAPSPEVQPAPAPSPEVQPAPAQPSDVAGTEVLAPERAAPPAVPQADAEEVRPERAAPPAVPQADAEEAGNTNKMDPNVVVEQADAVEKSAGAKQSQPTPQSQDTVADDAEDAE